MAVRKLSLLAALLSLSLVFAVSARAQVVRLNVSPDFVFFTQTGSTAPQPVQVKVSALSSSATSGALGAFTTKVSTVNGGAWLSATPTSGSGNSTLTVSANTAGLAAGEYVGSVTITAAAAANSPYTLGVSLTILAPALLVRPSSLNFEAVSGGAVPAAQSLQVSVIGGGSFAWTATATVSTPTGGKWLKLPVAAGSNGASVSVGVDPTGLAAGKYSGEVDVTTQINGKASTAKIPVTLKVDAPKPPALQLNPTSLNITYDPSSTAATAVMPAIQVTNSGSGTINWTAKVSVDSPSGGTWLAVSSSTGITPGTIAVKTTPTGLKPGTYSGTIAVTGTSTTSSTSASALAAKTRVFFTVRAPALPSVSVTPGAVGFNYANGVLTPQSTTIAVTSKSTGLSYTAAAATAKGGSWLTVAPASGTVTASSSITVGVSSAVAASLSAGVYTGTITIKAPGAAKSSFTVLASLEVFKSGVTPFFDLEPGTLVFTSASPTANPAAQSTELFVTGSATLAWSTKIATATADGAWLTVSSASGAGTSPVKVSVDASKLKSGSHEGTVTFNAASTTTTSTKPVTLHVRMYVGGSITPPVTIVGEGGGGDVTAQIATGEVPSSAQALFLRPADGSSHREGLPVNVSVLLVDANGAAIDSTQIGAQVVVKSAGGESDLLLESQGGGVYSALFQPLSGGAMVLTAAAGNAQSDTVSGDVQPNDDALPPMAFQGGLVNAASFEASPAPVAPGSLVSLFGRNLSATGGTSTSVPLSFKLGDVSVTVGGLPAALVTADAAGGQINLQIPFGVEGEQADIVVNSGGQLSAPITVQLAAASPALFTLSQDGTGSSAALHADYSAVHSGSPAKAGDTILLYATGLGALSTPVADGAAAGSVRTAGVVTVTIGGVSAIVDYAGTAPGFPGLYQINARIPAGLAAGDAAVVIAVDGVSGTSLASVNIR